MADQVKKTKKNKENRLGFKVVDKQEPPVEIPRLWARYKNEVKKNMIDEFNYKNVHQVPNVEKISINMGLGVAVAQPNVINDAIDELTLISGQRAIVRHAKKSISNFKLREGMPIGCSVTLRRKHMWEFLDRLFSIAMPRIRDFKGMNGKSFDGNGNYNLGIREQIIFPEISYESLDIVKGLNISFVTSAKTDEEAKALLKYLGMPFRN